MPQSRGGTAPSGVISHPGTMARRGRFSGVNSFTVRLEVIMAQIGLRYRYGVLEFTLNRPRADDSYRNGWERCPLLRFG